MTYKKSSITMLCSVLPFLVWMLITSCASPTGFGLEDLKPGAPEEASGWITIPKLDSTTPSVVLTVRGLDASPLNLRSGMENLNHTRTGGNSSIQLSAKTTDTDGGAKRVEIFMQVSRRCKTILYPEQLVFAIHEPMVISEFEDPREPISTTSTISPTVWVSQTVSVSQTVDVADYLADCATVWQPLERLDLKIWARGANFHDGEDVTSSLKLSVWTDAQGNATQQDNYMQLITADDPEELQTAQKMGGDVIGILARFDKEWDMPEVYRWFARDPDYSSIQSNYVDVSFEQRRIHFSLIRFQNQHDDDWAIPGYVVSLKREGTILATKFMGLATVEDEDFWDDNPPSVSDKAETYHFAADIDEVVVWQIIKWSFFEPDLEEYQWIDLTSD